MTTARGLVEVTGTLHCERALVDLSLLVHLNSGMIDVPVSQRTFALFFIHCCFGSRFPDMPLCHAY